MTPTIKQISEEKYPFEHGDGVYRYSVFAVRGAFIAGTQYAGKEWISEKPEFKEDCILIAANKVRDEWSYSFFEIKWVEGYGENGHAYYWGIFEDDDEWGDIADLKADKYLMIPVLPTLQTNETSHE